MLEKVVDIVWVGERLDSIRAVDCSIGKAFVDSGKNFVPHYINTSKSILIFMPSTKDN